MKATAKDLRFHSREILESVLRGEEVTITYRGAVSAPCLLYVKIKSCQSIEKMIVFPYVIISIAV